MDYRRSINIIVRCSKITIIILANLYNLLNGWKLLASGKKCIKRVISYTETLFFYKQNSDDKKKKNHILKLHTQMYNFYAIRMHYSKS